jgi:uncharacterized membrane protein
MSYGQQPGGPHGQPPYGRPGYGQPGYGQQPSYGSPPQHNAPPQGYAPPQHYAPPGQGRPSRRGRRRHEEQQYDPYGQHGQHGQHDPYAGVPVQGRRRRAEAPTGGPVTDDDERWAVPAYVGMFVSGFVAPAIVLAAKGRTSPFARFHAVQALNLFVVVFAATFTAMLLSYFKGPGWLPLLFAVLAADCFVVIRAAIGANRCEWYRLPAILAWPIFR